MKKPILFLFLAPMTVAAQMPPNMDQAAMQQMIQQMQGMRNCLQNIDQNELQALQERGRSMQSDVKHLCSQGQRDQAQSTALKYALEMANDPAMKAMKKCGEQMKQFLPNMPQEAFPSSEELHNRHICDEM